MEQSDTKKSPFKFLDAYEKGDSEYFFGRDSEVRQLYDFVNKNRIVLVYGQSGTGKTSLIQCGLANEFDPTDWVPLFIRRGENLNESLLRVIAQDTPPSEQQMETLRKSIFIEMEKDGEHSSSGEDETFIAKVIYYLQKVTERCLRTVYLIFDQFEELLILASEHEKKLFIQTIKVLLSPDTIVGCHIIIVMREEYFAWLDTFEKDIPTLSDRRLRIESMRTPEIATVICNSCEKFNITLANLQENTQQIINALSRRGTDVSLPYLQVYLDQLWRIDYERTYPLPEGYTGSEKFPPLEFTTEEISEFGEIKDVMQRFLIEQKRTFHYKLKEKFPKESDALLDRILDSFVNDQGTKIPNVYVVQNGCYQFKTKSSKVLQDTDPQILKFALDFLQSSQILRNVGNSFELGHDILARLIDKQRDAKQQRLNGIRVMISLHRKSQETIPYDLVKRWDRSIGELLLSDEEMVFYNKSKAIGQKEEEERSLRQHIQELERKRKNARAKWLYLSGFILISILLFSYWKSLKVLDTYYAVDTLPKLDSLTNQQDALIIADYLNNYTASDSVKRNIVHNKMMEIVQKQSFASMLSNSSYRLQSSATLVSHMDIDISGNGKYIAVKNDSVSSQAGLVFLFNLDKKDTIRTFRGVKYSYFLNHSDTLLLALAISNANAKSTLSFLSSNPDKFLLFNCRNGKTDTIYLNNAGSLRNFLFEKERLKSNYYSDWDSYFVRKMKSGKLVVPYFHIDNSASFNSEFKILFGEPNKFLDILNSSRYTISTSKQSDKILYAVRDKGTIKFKVQTDSFQEYQLADSASYADFTASGHIIYTIKNNLAVALENGTILKQSAISSDIVKVYSQGADFVFVEDAGSNLILIDLAAGKNLVQTGEQFVGANYKTKVFLTQKPSVTEDSTYLILRNFKGEILKMETINKGIESLEYNIETGDLLVKSNQLSPGNLQLLYLWDCNLVLKGSFFLTPNDSFGFSNNGQKFFYVRDNELSVFANSNKLWDVSNFNSIQKRLVKLKETDRSNFKLYLAEILKKYNIPKSPTEKFRL